MQPILLLAENTSVGGINSYVVQLARALRHRQVIVEVVAIWPKDECWLNVQCDQFGIPLRVLAAKRSAALVPNCVWKLARWLSTGGYGILHMQGHYSDLVGRAAYLLSGRKVRLVSTVHGIADDPRFSLRALYWMDWKTYGCNHATIANSEHTALQLRNMKVDARNLQVVLPGVATEIHNVAAVPPRQAIDRAASPVVFVGRLSSEKGCEVLIEAAHLLKSRNRPVGITIVGEGPERRALERQVENLGLEETIRFVGWQSDVRPYYEGAEVVVVPSLRESFGLTVLEGMKCGRTVIASRVEGIPEIISHGETGLLTDPGDASALADALELTLQDSLLRSRLGAAARNTVERRYSIDAMVARTLDVYRDALRC